MFGLEGLPFFYLGLGIILVIILTQAIHIVKEYERGVIFRLGRLVATKGPGLILIIPILDQIYRIPLRTVVYDVPEQEVVTRDNVTCRVNAVLYYRVVDPEKSVINVEKYHEATIQLAQTTMRSVAGQAELDELLSEREKLNKQLQQIIDEATDPWGIKVSAVELKDVVIPNNMQRAIARQAEAERERRAIVIQAQGEKQAAQQIAEASEILGTQKGAMNLRTLRTISETASEGSTILFPLPLELLRYFDRSSDESKGDERQTTLEEFVAQQDEEQDEKENE